MPWIQIERFPCQLLGLPPIALHHGVSLFNQGIGQNCSGQRIILVELISFTQQFDSLGFVVREQILPIGHQEVGFRLSLHAILSELLEFYQFRIVGKFRGRPLQQIERASVVAGMQARVNLFDQTCLGFAPSLLVAPLLQTFHLERQPWILAVDRAQDLPIVERIAVRTLFFVKVCPGNDRVDQVAFVLHQPQSPFEVRLSGMQIERLAQNVHALVQVRLRFYLAIDRCDEG